MLVLTALVGNHHYFFIHNVSYQHSIILLLSTHVWLPICATEEAVRQ